MELNSFQQSLHNTAKNLAERFRKTESDLIEVLLKIDEAKVFLILGYSSLYTYAQECLGLSEANAYAFTSVARKSKMIPELRTEIQSGNLSVSKARRILPVITPENKAEWITKAVELPKIELEREVMKADPEAEKRVTIRVISENRFSMKLGISKEVLEKIKRAQVLLMNRGRKNLSIEQTLEALADGFLEREDPIRKAKRVTQSKVASETKALESRPVNDLGNNKRTQIPIGKIGPGQKALVSSYKRKPLPMAVKHEVVLRDSAQCQFESADHRICGGMAYIEIHHKRFVAKGGPNSVDNLVTLCSKHHGFLHEMARSSPAR